MADSYAATDEPTQAKPAAEDETELAAAYWRAIKRYEAAAQEWTNDAEKIIDLFVSQGRASSAKRFAILYANVSTLQPAIYAKLPVGQCSRRFKDKEPAARIAAEIMERCGNATFDLENADDVFKSVRDDRLLAGRGTAWVRYEADIAGDKVEGERAVVDYVHWRDFGHDIARTWPDVRCVWRKVYMDRRAAKARFAEKASKFAYTAKPADEKQGEKDGPTDRACVYEIWDKSRRKVSWLSEGYEGLIETGAPPLEFGGFFPCPKPCYATLSTKGLIPTPDYVYYRDQAREINDLTDKIATMTDQLRLVGFIPGGPSSEGADAIEAAVKDALNTKTLLVKIDSWAAFTEKGGAGKMVDWVPIQHVVVALREAILTRQQIVQDVYQITGISDIMRGQTDPDETLGAQQLKSQTGDRRLRNYRDDLARFCRDIFRLVCEVAAEQFSPETLAAMSGFRYAPAAVGQQPAPMLPISAPGQPQPGMPVPMGGQMAAPGMQPMPPQQPAPEQRPEDAGVFDDRVVALLRNDRLRGFKIDIETDSTIQPDEDAEKQRRTEFLGAVGNFLKQAQEVITAAPQLAPMAGETLSFAARGFRAGRMMEETIERGIQSLTQQTQGPRPDPKMAEAQAQIQIDQQKAQAQAQADAAKAQADVALSQQKAAADAEIARMKAQADIEIAQRKADADIEIAKMKAACDTEIKQRQADQDHENRATSMAAERAEKKQKGEGKQQPSAVKVNLSDAIGKDIASVIEQAFAGAAAMIEKAGDTMAERLSSVTVKMAPRRRVPKYDRAGNIVETREFDEGPEVQGAMQ